jgi:hypothetical protein
MDEAARKARLAALRAWHTRYCAKLERWRKRMATAQRELNKCFRALTRVREDIEQLEGNTLFTEA